MVKAGVIAAVYTALTVLLPFLSYGGMQIRFSEALTVLPWFTSSAVPGLFVGCLLANFFGSPLGMFDVILGSLTTLLAAWITTKIKNKRLVPLPSILLNALLIPFVLWQALSIPYYISVVTVGAGQLIAVYGVGYPLLLFIERNQKVKEIISD